MGRETPWRRIVSSGRLGLILVTLWDALCEEIGRGLCESFQLPVETSRRVWKYGEEVETRATACVCMICQAFGTGKFGSDRAWHARCISYGGAATWIEPRGPAPGQLARRRTI